jgi:uncharacterized protein
MEQALAELASQGHIYFILLLIVVGVFGGYVAGLFGIGGGVVLVPAFVTVFPYFGTSHSVLMHAAVGTCLALIVPGALMSSRKQLQQGNLDLRLLRSWLPAVCVGIVIGALLMRTVPTTVLKLFFVVFLLCVTIYALVERHSDDGGDGVPPPGMRNAGGLLIGGLSVILGIGGGTFSVPFFRFFHYPLKRAIALSSATGIFIGAGGAIGAILTGWGVAGRAPHSLGYVSVSAFLVLAPCMMIFSPLGSRTANALPERLLKCLFIVFLAVMTVYMAFQTYAGIEAH